jgi:AAA+ superfamily predicted ATPase
LFRRFDDVLHYQLPDDEERKRLMGNLLAAFTPKRFKFEGAVEASKDLSHAEIDKACRDAIKEVILAGSSKVTAAILEKRLKDRQHAYQSP